MSDPVTVASDDGAEVRAVCDVLVYGLITQYDVAELPVSIGVLFSEVVVLV